MKESLYENEEHFLGMKFRFIEDAKVAFSVWLTRVSDFQAFANEVEHDSNFWKTASYKGHSQELSHPVVMVDWFEASLFCEWLTAKDAKYKYRLPTDAEWSAAIGLAALEIPNSTPKEKHEVANGFPWNGAWPPPDGYCNWAGDTTHPFTSPVGYYSADHQGIKDLCGNVWEWTADWYDDTESIKSTRGASFIASEPKYFKSSFRGSFNIPKGRSSGLGFRCVRHL